MMWRYFRTTRIYRNFNSSSNNKEPYSSSTHNGKKSSYTSWIGGGGGSKSVATTAALLASTTTAQCPLHQNSFPTSSSNSTPAPSIHTLPNPESTTRTTENNYYAAVQCETPKSSDTNDNDQNKKEHTVQHKSTANFRQRRLTLHSSPASKKGSSASTTSATDSKDDDKRKNTSDDDDDEVEQIIYPSVMKDEEENGIQVETTKIESTTLNRVEEKKTRSSLPSSAMKKKKRSNKVASYSCHGVEPQPHLVTEDEEFTPQSSSSLSWSQRLSESTSNNNSFFSQLFGTSSSSSAAVSNKPTRMTRRRTRLITVAQSKINQDRGHVIFPYGNHAKTALFGIYDGHGEKGELLAEYTMNALSEELKIHPAFLTSQGKSSGRRIMRSSNTNKSDEDDGIAVALKDTICAIDEKLKTQSNLQSDSSGSTACIALLREKAIWMANVGDSRAVLGQMTKTKGEEGDESSHSICAIDLTKDQNANDIHERKRILNSGGYITMPADKTLAPRVWLDEECSNIGLAMSRSIGDHALEDAGVIAVPVIQKYDLKDEDNFLIIASDGVWEFISSKEAVEICQKCFDDGLDTNDTCKELIRVAIRRWKEIEGNYRDDITAIVVCLRDFWDK